VEVRDQVALAHRKDPFPLAPIVWEAGWTPESLWMRLWREKKIPSLPLPGIKLRSSSS